MSPIWLLLAVVAGGTLGGALMAALAMGARADLEREIGQYQARIRRLANDCHCTCGDGA